MALRNVHFFKNFDELSNRAFRVIDEYVQTQPKAILGIATGESTKGIYKRMGSHKTHYNNCSLVQLDEWIGLEYSKNSCKRFIENELEKPLNIDASRVLYYNTSLENPEEIAKDYQKKIDRLNPIDIFILGFGKNGHIGFIEPSLNERPHKCFVADLDDLTQEHSMVQTESNPPHLGVCLGWDTILSAKKIILLITGSNKEVAFNKFMSQNVTPTLPASKLWEHSDLEVYTTLSF